MLEFTILHDGGSMYLLSEILQRLEAVGTLRFVRSDGLEIEITR
jgi:hypothetical protein